jgi:hypothetical protein
LAQVMASALVAQSNLILDADGALDIAEATKAQQKSTSVQTFVMTNKAVLSNAPSAATEALKTQLLEQVGGDSGTPPTPNPANLLTNGDFSKGAAGWGGNALDVRTEGGNSFSFANVATAGNPWDVSLKYVLNIPNSGVKYKLRFKASSDKSRTLIAGFGLDQDPWTNATETVNLTNIQTTFELSLTSNFAGANSRVFFDMGAAVGTVVIDDVELVLDTADAPAADCSTSTTQCVSFSEANAGANPFEKLVSAEVMPDPAASTNKLLKMVKGPGSEPWAGATVYTSTAGEGDKTIRTVPAVGLNVNKSVTVRVNSGSAVGTKIGLKLENALKPTDFVIAEAVTTKQNAWETLTFNFANLTAGTFDANATYNMASLFPAFSETGGASPALMANTTFYFDELTYAMSTATPPLVTGTVVADFDTVVPVVRGPDSGARACW